MTSEVFFNFHRFHPDPELTEILGKLWEMDTNKCYAGQDFDIDLQGECIKRFVRLYYK